MYSVHFFFVSRHAGHLPNRHGRQGAQAAHVCGGRVVQVCAPLSAAANRCAHFRAMIRFFLHLSLQSNTYLDHLLSFFSLDRRAPRRAQRALAARAAAAHHWRRAARGARLSQPAVRLHAARAHYAALYRPRHSDAGRHLGRADQVVLLNAGAAFDWGCFAIHLLFDVEFFECGICRRSFSTWNSSPSTASCDLLVEKPLFRGDWIVRISDVRKQDAKI